MGHNTSQHALLRAFLIRSMESRKAVVDAQSGLAIVEATYPNNMTDKKIARKLYNKLKILYKPHKGFIVIAAKVYDVSDFYTFLVKQSKAQPIIAINPRNTQPDLKYSEKGGTTKPPVF